MNLTAVAILISLATGTALADAKLSSERRAQLMDVLSGALQRRGEFSSIHAAEDLIQLGEAEQVRHVFAPQADDAPPPYRIGVWRVLARCASDDAAREQYINRIRAVMLDPSAPDTVHAMEALAKLNAPIHDSAEQKRVERVAFGEADPAPFAAWRLVQAHDSRAMHRLTELLQSQSEIARARAADVLRRLDSPATDVRQAIAAALAHEPKDSLARPMLVAAVGGSALRDMLNDSTPNARAIAAMQLAEKGDAQDSHAIEKLLSDSDRDVRIAAAYALLRIDQRINEHPEPAKHEDR